jgi:uncharacterized protein (AIM24 family)
MNSNDIDYKIFDNDLQIIEIELDPGENVIAEAGAMICTEESISFEVKLGDGTPPI